MAKRNRSKKPVYYKPTKKPIKKRYFLLVLLIPVVIAGLWLIVRARTQLAVISESPSSEAVMAVPPTPAVLSDDTGYVEEAFVTEPTAFAYSDPANFGFKTYLMFAGEAVDSYERDKVLRFPSTDAYTELSGVTTYRGNNYRSSGTYGSARITDKTLSILWTHNLPEFALTGPEDGTAQPLIVQWPADIMADMSFKTGKKDKVQLTEVIFADKSGNIIFLDLEDGDYSRTPIPTIAYTEGTPTLDPRGIPLLYVGQSVQEDGDTTRSRYQYLYVFDLTTGKQVYRFGSSSIEPFANNEWQGYTGSPLVYDDQILIEAESGILYSYAIGAEFDKEKGEIYITEEPSLVKYKYENQVTGYFVSDDPEAESTTGKMASGTTGSLAGYKEYAFFSDRSGFLQCINVNDMSLVYAVDIKGGGDATVNIEDEGADSNTFFVYSGTRFGYSGADESLSETNTAYFRKIEGLTGKVLWEKAYDVVAGDDCRAGLAETALIGENSLSRYIYYAVVGEQSADNTTLYCVNKSDGEIIWQYQIASGFKSVPTAMYDKSGNGYVIMGDLSGDIYFFDGTTGEIIGRLALEAGVDGSPAVFNNKIVMHLNNDTLVCVKVE